MAQKVHGRSGGSGRRRTFGTPLDIKKTEENVKKFSEIVRKDRRIAEMANMDKETARQILHDRLDMRKVYTKVVPKNLTQEQKTSGETFALTSWNEPQNNRMSLKMSSHVMKRGFFNTPGNLEAIEALEDIHLTENEKSKNEQVESEGNDDRFLRHQSRSHDCMDT
jgi:hypothetical protein